MKFSFIILLLLFGTSSIAATSFAEADAKCKTKRDSLLKEVRLEKISSCKLNKEFAEPGGCENFYSDYGNAQFNPAGYQIKKGMFDDIPECQYAQKLQNSTERN